MEEGVITTTTDTTLVVNFASVGEKKLGYEVCIKNKLIEIHGTKKIRDMKTIRVVVAVICKKDQICAITRGYDEFN